MKDEIMEMSTAERRNLADQFTGSTKRKIMGAEGLTKEDKAAIKFAANLVGTLAQSWRTSGRKPIKDLAEAGRDALYLRKYRSGKALAAALEAGSGRVEVKRLRDEFDAATADYEKYKRLQKKASK
jgi:hypothetical protein